MRIALYGTDGDKLQKHKQRLYKNIVAVDDTVEIICCQDEKLLKENLKDFQMIFMEETALDKFEQYMLNNYLSTATSIFLKKKGKSLTILLFQNKVCETVIQKIESHRIYGKV